MKPKRLGQELREGSAFRVLGSHILPLVLVCWFGLLSPGLCAQHYWENSLTMVVPGMSREVDYEWLERLPVVPHDPEIFVLLQDQQQLKEFRKNFNFAKNQQPKLIGLWMDDQKLSNWYDRIAKTKTAIVLVDANAEQSISVPNEWNKWAEPVGRAMAEILERSRRQHGELCYRLLVGNCAGAEPIKVVHRIEQERYGSDGPPKLFHETVATSVMSSRGLRKGTTLVYQAGDFHNPSGSRGGWRIIKDISHIEKIADPSSYKVIGVADREGKPQRTVILIPNVYRIHNRLANIHRTGMEVYVFPQDGGKPVQLPNTSVGRVLEKIVSPSGFQGPSNQHGARLDSQRLKVLAEQVRKSEPTPNLGGISLNAIARIPINPNKIRYACYSAKDERIYLKTVSGETIWFPRMNPEILRLSYESAYLAGEKPELSIGTVPGDGQGIIRHPHDKHPVYYLGKSRDTLLGQALFNADQCLGELTWGSGPPISDLAARVQGFQSMPELYPEKYTEEGLTRAGSGPQTVFLHPSCLAFNMSRKGDALEFGKMRFVVRFGDTGPAESAFGAFFSEHFEQIAKTKHGAPLAKLVPYAQAVALFSWLKENDILFGLDNQDLRKVPITRVFTAPFTDIRLAAARKDIVLRRPSIQFGDSGPVRVLHADGRDTVITYENGRPIRVQRGDGKVLEILRNDSEITAVVRIENSPSACFYVDKDRGPVFAEGGLVYGESGKSKIYLTEKTKIYPDNQPEATIDRIVLGFVFDERR